MQNCMMAWRSVVGNHGDEFLDHRVISSCTMGVDIVLMWLECVEVELS